ncbi:CRISPR-associated endonuclease Cas3'' [Halosegnis longus]|uniref:CRISPR-associated endonuclease Cas3'' n=1 Tax=Halosegnis longus TaxID=2216012 RepID=UPI00096AC19F|nr:CRISPR-associated endonuclease Cas3'' [Salella cibi]
MPQDIGPEAIASRADDGIATELLTDHAEQVATRAAWLTTESARLDSEAASLIEPVGRLHDAGKAVPAFQRYLRNEYTGERKYTYHARLGAFAVAHVLAERGASRHEQLAGWAAILRHHGQLPDLVDETIRVLRAEWNSDNDAWVEEQIDRIDEAEASRNVFDTLLRTASDGTTDWATFHEAMANRTVHGGC